MLIRFTPRLYDQMLTHLRAEQTEQVGFLYLRPGTTETLVEDYYGVPSGGLVEPSTYHAEVSEDTQRHVLKEATRRGLFLGEVHSHPIASRHTAFSGSDLSGFAEFVPYVRWRLRQGSYVALVFSRNEFDSLVWEDTSDVPTGVATLTVDDRRLEPTRLTWDAIQKRIQQDRERYARQSLLFGIEGQNRLRHASVGIVGLGGLGSHVAQQLAFLGIRRFVFVDADLCERTNLNRLIGATEADIGLSKTQIAARLVRAIQADAQISAIEAAFPSALADSALGTCSVIFGCVDGDRVRLSLLEYSCTRGIPYLDLASDAEQGFGGRVVFTGLGRGCLFCRGELDQKEIWRSGANASQRQEDDRIYGVSRHVLDGAGPSVVSVNGVVASLGVTEFLLYMTGLRKPVAHLNYRGDLGVVTKGEPPSHDTCYYCGDLWSASRSRR